MGKSTLFNRLTGKRSALVDNTPGLTRDRKEGVAMLGDMEFRLIDTAGLEEAENASVEALMMEQTEIAMQEADILCMVIDGRDGVTPTDEHFAGIVRRKNKPVCLLVNKCEGKKSEEGIQEAYNLGLGEPIPISAEHGLGLGELYTTLQEIQEKESFDNAIPQGDPDAIQIAIVGRPNAGKSTLFNAFLGSERSIAGPVAGMTRDSVYVDWKYKNQSIQLVDTAGMRKRAKRHEKLEKMAVDDTFKAIQYSSIVVLLVDGTSPLDKQDLTLADHVLSEGRGLIIGINKWDLVKDKDCTLENIQIKLEHSLSQAKGVPLITLSALNESNIFALMKEALRIYKLWNQRVSTGPLNRWLQKATSQHLPPLSGTRRIRLRYITQAKSRPPTFIIFSSSAVKDLPDSYLRYLMNSLRDEFKFYGTPVRITLRKSDNPYEGK